MSSEIDGYPSLCFQDIRKKKVSLMDTLMDPLMDTWMSGRIMLKQYTLAQTKLRGIKIAFMKNLLSKIDSNIMRAVSSLYCPITRSCNSQQVISLWTLKINPHKMLWTSCCTETQGKQTEKHYSRSATTLWASVALKNTTVGLPQHYGEVWP